MLMQSRHKSFCELILGPCFPSRAINMVHVDRYTVTYLLHVFYIGLRREGPSVVESVTCAKGVYTFSIQRKLHICTVTGKTAELKLLFDERNVTRKHR